MDIVIWKFVVFVVMNLQRIITRICSTLECVSAHFLTALVQCHCSHSVDLAAAGSCFQWKSSKNPLSDTCSVTERQRSRLADENSGAFSSKRARYFPQELVETIVGLAIGNTGRSLCGPLELPIIQKQERERCIVGPDCQPLSQPVTFGPFSLYLGLAPFPSLSSGDI